MVVNSPSAMIRLPLPFLILGLLAAPFVAAYAEDTALEMRPIVPDGTEGSVKMKLESSSKDASPQVLSCGKEVLLDSSAVKDSYASNDPLKGWSVTAKLTEKGKQQLLEATSKNLNKRIGIISGGRLISAPMVHEPIAGGTFEIAGNFTEAAAHALADIFMKGVKPETTDPAKKP